MEHNQELDLNKDDLPLCANTNHMLVRHYVLDLSVNFQRNIIGGSIVLFLEPGPGTVKSEELYSEYSSQKGDPQPPPVQVSGCADVHNQGTDSTEIKPGFQRISSHEASKEFTLILDCCDLLVSKVAEVDVCSVPDLQNTLKNDREDCAQPLSNDLVKRLIAIPSTRWRHQKDLYLQCSRASAVDQTEPLEFHMDKWSLQITKKGVYSPHNFPCILRIWYETKPTGGSVSWTKDQDGSFCVYTMGSTINNRALFPCQEPPVAMSTWQACVRAPCEYVVLMSGENQAVPIPDKTGFLKWDYYVVMPMPASTFTIAVGKWRECKTTIDNPFLQQSQNESGCAEFYSRSLPTKQSCKNQNSHSNSGFSTMDKEDLICCSHVDYPCRFMETTSKSQVVIPHRVFAPSCHLQRSEFTVVPLLPLCLAAAYSILGIHPFTRLDVLIVPPGFSSLGMARYVFLAFWVTLVTVNKMTMTTKLFGDKCKLCRTGKNLLHTVKCGGGSAML